MASGADQHSSIPMIDLGPARTGSEEDTQRVAKELYEAFRNVGFAYVKNHGVPQDVVDEAFLWSRKFFSLPQSDKDKAPHPPKAWHHRGYSSVGREKVSQMIFDEESIAAARKVPDVKESFDIGRDDDAAYMANVWPPQEMLPGFREFFTNFYEVCYAAEMELLKLVALGMGLKKEYFMYYHENKDNQIRLLRYPTIEEDLLRQGKAERIAAHTDFGTITMLFQDDVGGLEVEDVREKGKFSPAPYIPNTAVVNIGDFLMRWSNDELKSTMHRVKAPPLAKGEGESLKGKMTRERYSIVYFMGVDMEKTVDCVPGCWGPERPKKYEPVKCADYVNMRMEALY
ncbi:flavonol synthase flavanone 3-hydroxylase [Trichoderma arundinaceum]|uniref:Flavonol synthase flavanone 3-hydroxylase n=1 Tax=Trichoderma arundinaceum TaxID=490622 RepID=A0A395NHK1_TRIAR|nr:flavonol synthase flavanone 3-hydroxylase [Trichoderma arundinaceum]